MCASECASTMFSIGIAWRIRMKRRWKVMIALAVVGLAGFLVWAFLSPATPALTVRFCGYTTNYAFRVIEAEPPKDGSVFAIFAVTNHSGRVMEMLASQFAHSSVSETGSPVTWIATTNSSFITGATSIAFRPGEGAWVAARVSAADQPVLVFVHGRYLPDERTARRAWWSRLPWNQRNFFATATNELR